MTPLYAACFAAVIGAEGGMSTDRNDPGNWTGGAVGSGKLLGTKYGISAASYPKVDIANLTLQEAQVIYARDYWTPICGDGLPGSVALHVFDGAVNSGIKQSAMWLQQALGFTGGDVDGWIGPQTLAAAAKADAAALCAEIRARRVVFLAGLSTWRTYGLGWARRVSLLPVLAASLPTT